MNFKYHGLFCGPGWSDGQYKADAAGFGTPVSYFDACCKDHDRDIGRGVDRTESDKQFAKCALSAGRLIESLAVPVYGLLASNKTKFTMPKKNMRSISAVGKNKNNVNDTKIAAPVSIATKRTGKAAKVVNGADGTIRVSHRAFITPLACQSAYTANKIPCNPGLSGSFPWLSKLARKYDLYRIVSLRYMYRSVTATSTPGVMMFSFDFDAADDVPSSKAKQAQTVPNIETNCWSTMDLTVRCDNQWRYVRPGVLASNLDVKTYDFGNLIWSSIYGNNTVTGELYVEYTVELKKPSDGSDDSGAQTFGTTSFAGPFVSPAVATGYIPCTPTGNTTLQFITSGEWILIYTAVGTVLSAPPGIPTIATSGSGVIGNLTSTFGSTVGIRVVKIRAEMGDIMTLTSAGAGSTITSGSVRFSPCDYDNMV